ncbi:hypothetical protein CH06BL_34710 [Chromobacterium haemolyticum]|nr:hypothetical protein CH06BL_34710 [Chromobacterium haemolyticum]
MNKTKTPPEAGRRGRGEVAPVKNDDERMRTRWLLRHKKQWAARQKTARPESYPETG